jgi:hypothetical protein
MYLTLASIMCKNDNLRHVHKLIINLVYSKYTEYKKIIS